MIFDVSLRSLISSFLFGMLISACNPLSPSNESPSANDLQLNKDEGLPQGNPSNGANNNRKSEDDINSEPFVAENEFIGSYRGYAAVTFDLRSRLTEPGTAFDLAFYLDGAGGTSPDNIFRGELFKLLGSYQSDGLRSDFQNGQPNGINLLVWHLTLSGLGEELGLECAPAPVVVNPTATHPPISLNSLAKAAIRGLCQLETLPQSQQKSALETFWHALSGWEQPESERDAWLIWALSPEQMALLPDERVAVWTEAALLNPHFLLRK